jgi:hypothetical protein
MENKDNNIVVLNKTGLPNTEDTGKRFPTNPFFDYFEIKEKDKMIFAKTDSQALNPKTGEIMGQQIVARFKKVDAGQFVKIFTDKISTILDLSKAGHKLLTVVLSLIQHQAMNTDVLFMPLIDAQEEAKKVGFVLSKRTYERAIADIIRRGILARHYSPNMYFINPAIIYNGDRTKITFVEQFEIVSEEELSQPSLLE